MNHIYRHKGVDSICHCLLIEMQSGRAFLKNDGFISIMVGDVQEGFCLFMHMLVYLNDIRCYAGGIEDLLHILDWDIFLHYGVNWIQNCK